ncbi:MAG: amidohydrolase family protein [Calditrichia bacterium]
METRILSNIFLTEKGNRLHLADLVFDQRIREVRIKTPRPISWEEISHAEARNQWIEDYYRRHPESAQQQQPYSFLLAIPGAIDPHVHFDTPGFEFREDFEHGSRAAAWGGVTCVIDMPCTSLPPVTSKKHLQEKARALEGRSLVDYAFWGGVRGNDFSRPSRVKKQILELADSGVVGFKAYLVSGMDTFTDLTLEQMEQVARWIQPTGLPLAVHAEDKNLVLSRQERMQKIGKNDWCGYYYSRDERAEALAVIRMINIARKTQCPVHIVHLSTEFGLELVEHARQEGVAVTAETCPHYLYFTRDDFENPEISNYLKTAPPVKTEFDRQALWEGLSRGVLSFVTTDHAGCQPEQEKSSDNFWKVYGGIPGVEHRVPFLFSEGVCKGRLSLQQTVELLSTNIATFFRLLPTKGHLQPGSDADISLIDLWSKERISAGQMHSKGRYTPFEGAIFQAVVQQVILRGRVVVTRSGTAEGDIGYGRPLYLNIH